MAVMMEAKQEKKPRIASQLECLAGEISAAEGIVLSLASRLGSVLEPVNSDKNIESAAIEVPMSEVSRMIGSAASRVNLLAHNLHDLLDRLEV